MAASMLEKVSGKSWETLVDEFLNKPLHISVKFGWPANADSSAPLGHWFQSGVFHSESKNTWLQLNAILYPSHNINISLPDYILFMQENLSGLLGKKAHLSQETFQYLHFGILDYALGWNNGSLDDHSYSFHEGQSLLFNCRAEIIKEKNLGIIVMCNSGDHDGRGGVLNLSRLIEQKYLSQ
jgi:CubicO group peptidase (beta-lactamase class C family)